MRSMSACSNEKDTLPIFVIIIIIIKIDFSFHVLSCLQVLSGPEGQVYKQQQMSVFQNPESGVVAIRSRRSRETRSKTQQLG